MKRIAIVLGLLFGLMLGVGVLPTKAAMLAPAASRFEGDWIGVVKMADSGKMNIRLKVSGNDGQLFYKDFHSFWQPMQLSPFHFDAEKENAVFTWKKEGSCRSETTTYTLTLKDNGMIEVGFTRQINNLRIFGGDDVQKIEGVGKLWRIS